MNTLTALLTTTRLMSDVSFALVQNTDEMNTAAVQYDQLRNLKSNVELYGMSRPVMMVVNYDQALSRVVTDVPSTESLDVVPVSAKDNRTKEFLTNINTTLDSEKVMVADWMKTSLDQTESLLSIASDAMDGFKSEMTALDELTKNKKLNAASLSVTMSYLPKLSTQVAKLKEASVIFSNMLPIDMTTLKSDAEYRGKVDAALESAAASLTGLKVENHQVVVNKSSDLPEMASLLDLGYTAEGMNGYMESATEMLTHMDAFMQNRHDIVAGVQAALDNMPTDDEDEDDDASKMEHRYTLAQHRRLVGNYLQVLHTAMSSGSTALTNLFAAGAELVPSLDSGDDVEDDVEKDVTADQKDIIKTGV